MRVSFFHVAKRKMATAKSLEDMLSSEVDESAVSALVGSLESQLSSSSIHLPSQDLTTTSVTLNHVKNATVVDGGVTRLHDGQKHGVNAVSQGISLTNSGKSQVVNSQIVDVNSTVSTTSNPLSVMVTLPGALPASGYITQVTGPSQQTLFTSAVTGTATARPLNVNNQDIKIVYSPQPSVTQLNTTTVSAVNNATVYSQRNNLKIASVPNGSPSPVGMITVRPTQPLVTVAAVNPIIPGSTTSMSAIQNLANIASQQTPIVIPNACQATSSVQQVASVASQHHQPQVQVNIGNGKQVIAARMTVREQIEIKHTDKNGKQVPTSHSQVISTPSTSIQSTAISQMNSGVIQVGSANPAAKGHTQTGQQVNVVTQVVSNPSIIPGVQIVNVNPARMGAPGIPGQKTLAPRVVFSNPVRIAAAPQILTARPGAPGVQVSGQNTITLQPGMVRGAILVKTENGQLQVVNVAPSLSSSSSTNSLPGAATYRLQSIQPGAQGVRTVTPQQMTVTVPVSVSATGVKTNQQATVTTPQAVVSTLLQQTSSLNAVNSRPATPNNTTPSGTQSQQTVAAKMSGLNGNLSAPLTIQTTMANNQTSSAPSQMSPNTAKKKCKNFLSTLIRLASDQPDQVATNVRSLIQGLIDGTIQAEEFTSQLQKELNSSPQPCLVPFLKKNLPFLRHSLITKELTIEGVRPPPSSGTVILPTSTASLQQLQSHFPRQNAKSNINRQLLLKENITKVSQNRPGSQQTATQVRVMASAGSGTLTAQLLQPSQNVIAQRLVTPRLPAALVGQAKSLLVTAPANKSSIPGVSTAALSPATVGVLQAKSPALIKTPLSTNKDREKRSFSSLKDDDDINDVAAMGGVNLVEESQRILASNAEIVGMQIRSCKDESFLFTGPLQERISTIAERLGMDDISPEVVTLISHAAQNRLKSLIEKLGVIAEHRVENAKSDLRYEATHDVKGQLKFLEELDRIEKRRHEEQEREMLLRAAKSRSKLEDPEQLKLKQKAKEMQRAEMQERQYHDSNETALKAIGQRKRMKLDSSSSGLNQLGVHGFPGLSNSGTKVQARPRVKRVNLRDLLYLMEQERETVRTPLLYKSYMK